MWLSRTKIDLVLERDKVNCGGFLSKEFLPPLKCSWAYNSHFNENDWVWLQKKSPNPWLHICKEKTISKTTKHPTMNKKHKIVQYIKNFHFQNRIENKIKTT